MATDALPGQPREPEQQAADAPDERAGEADGTVESNGTAGTAEAAESLEIARAADPTVSPDDSRPIRSLAEFQAGVRGLIDDAARVGSRRMWWVSADFEHWPLEETAVLDTLTGWARARSVDLHWLASDFESLRRRMPRLVRWRQTWAHVLHCSAPDREAMPSLPTLLLVDGVGALQMFDNVHWRGRISRQRPDLVRIREQIDALSQRSEPAFPATTLGI